MTERYILTALILGALFMMSARSDAPRGIRNNNPLNIRKSADNWKGQTGDDGEFVQFTSPVMGVRAAARILKNYRNIYNRNTISGVIERWAPSSENDTMSYIKSVAQKINIDPHQVLSERDYP